MGVVGGVGAVNRFVYGESRGMFNRTSAAIYVVSIIALTFVYARIVRESDNFSGLYLLVALSIAVLGHLLWIVGFVIERVMKAGSPTQLPVEQTFDVGDGLMLKGRYAEAEAQFRQDVAAEPMNVNATLRLIRAMEAGGKLQEAVEELYRAHKNAIAEQKSPKLKKDDHQQRILRITFALGDILTMKFDDPPRALALYRNTLEVLAGFADAEVLRERLKLLEAPDRMSVQDAIEKVQPTKIKL
jgi:hypothetical protein